MLATMTVIIAAMASIAIIATFIMPLVTAIVRTGVTAIEMVLPVLRCVLPLVPIVLHKINTLVAGIVSAAILAPIFRVPRRDTQVNRFTFNGYVIDHPWLAINNLRWRITTNVQLPVKARLTDAHRNTEFSTQCHRGACGQAGSN